MAVNRLGDATSPYLQQHADNPVDWWPWCEEALQLAREQDKPILLSIGYSACHWCHVMAHESFEDPATAAVMNRLFVNIKVDREERPDLDRIYQTAYQMLARRAGGWPLTVFLMPDYHTPFFAGTYFPPQPRHGLPAFTDVLQQIARAYHERREDIDQQNASLRAALARLDASEPAEADSARPIDEAIAQLTEQFDDAHGGFGSAPKFPHPGTLRFLLREGTRRGDQAARHMALYTLDKMAAGGINDHLGGGFCRYSVDDMWMIPHFEKMLYDNGQLLGLYAEAWAADAHRPVFRHVCERTAEWIMREMQAETGGYFASLDADSEGEEGRYYVWQADEVRRLLDDDEFAVFAPRFGLDRPPNFEGRWHLHTFRETSQIAHGSGLGASEVRRRLLSARRKLFTARELRVRPGRDEKILTSWNALTIKGMATAGRLMQVPAWVDSAARAMDFLRRRHWQAGRLLATSRDGRAHLDAYLDDHAYLVDAALALLQARWDSDLLDFAMQVADRILAGFEDPDNGGFFFTADDHEKLVHRPKPLADDASPSGNSVAVEALQRLAVLSGELRYHDAAERALRAAFATISRSPYAHVGFLESLTAHLEPQELLVIRGTAEASAHWLETTFAEYVPGRSVFVIPPDIADLPPGLAGKTARAGSLVAYRCRGSVCEPPIEAADQLV
jgi:uncharacterized protein YyaL (SSP411 family)